MVDHSEHFSREELKCRCGCGYCEMDEGFMEKLECLRAFLNTPMVVLSGFRCLHHNTDIGGAKHSQHMIGRAVDIAITRVTPYRLLRTAMDYGFSGYGLQLKGRAPYIHLDTRHTVEPVMWTY